MAISPQVPAKNAEVKEKHKLGFPVLSDPGNGWARKLGLVYTFPQALKELYTTFEILLPEFNGDDSWELPLATRMVIDREGTIRSIDADPDYTLRPEPEASIEVLGSLD